MAPKSLTGQESDEREKDLEDLSKLEEQFAAVELTQQRAKEHALRTLYSRRQSVISRIPDFWSTIFLSPPPQIMQFIQPFDVQLLAHVTSFHVERFEISESGTEGDPRSLRIAFEFAPNEFIEDVRLVKELRYRHATRGSIEGLISDPVPIRWRSKKKDLTRGLGSSVMSLFEAEKAMKVRVNGKEIDGVSRGGLWQNERVLQGLQTMSELGQPKMGFFAWLYYRGVDLSGQRSGCEGDSPEEAHTDDEEDSDDGLRNVEIFPEGSDLANFLAEHVWEDAVDIYVEALKPPESDLSEESGDALDEETFQLEIDSEHSGTHEEAEGSVAAARDDGQATDANSRATAADVARKRKKARMS